LTCLLLCNLQVTTDVVALLDEWAARFFDELDYVKEGQNATLFAQQMAADLPQVGIAQGCVPHALCALQAVR
jgi:predicted unusual protein kinase regulating ubiquinone biosynthesis (AarF/ABC1/UbiB family)